MNGRPSAVLADTMVLSWLLVHDPLDLGGIAALALRLGLPLVSHDAIYRDVPGLTVLTANGR